ncbi:MAG: AMP-binding protein, partial [Desulfobacterales bacterium]|nr:AMP-binding protein [Desulfobacterales bacterium]
MSPSALQIREYTFANVIASRAQEIGERTFLLFEDQRYSYADLHRITNALANGLLAQGVGKGAHVALVLDNSPAMVWYYLALGKIGAVAVPLNTAARGELLGRYLRQADVSCVVTSPEYAGRLAEVAAGCPLLTMGILVGQQGAISEPLPGLRVVAHEILTDSPVHDPDVKVNFKDLACLMFTSGTTGPSKAIMSVQASIFAPAAAIGEAFGYGAQDVMYTCLPLFHGNAMRSLYVALLASSTIA